MKQIHEKRIKDTLTWVEPTFPPRPKRKALFSLMKYEGNLYFVNDSDEILTCVTTESSGFLSIDDEATVGLEENQGLCYTDVYPMESVKVEHYDAVLDSDFALGLDIFIVSKKLGKLHIRANSRKGGVKPQPLMWDDGSSPKKVMVEQL